MAEAGRHGVRVVRQLWALVPALALTLVVPVAAQATSTTSTTTTTTTSTTSTTTTTTTPATTTTTPAGHPVLAPMSGSYVINLTFDGLHRDYRIHVPPAAASGQPLPLVLNLAGATQNGQIEEILSDMDPNADENGYLVVYPDGTRISKVLTPDPVAKQAQYGWNAGECCGLPITRRINDVGFLEKVIADVAARTPVNLRRVYMTGISNGGMMSYAMAAEASTHVAAIASVSGQVELPVIHPSRPVPTMEFHSVNDPIAKFDGVPNKNPLLVLSVMQGIRQWVKADGCARTPKVGTEIVGAAGSISAGETATPLTYTHCKDGVQVVLWRFTGSGHVWPGSTLNTGPKKGWILTGSGRGIVLVNADETMWNFFSHYELPAKDVPRS
jgi:polyhydroxybutyrate depolymerase